MFDNRRLLMMSGRLSMLWTARQVNIAITINRFIFFLQKLPLIGKKVPNSLYGCSEEKLAITLIVLLWRIIRRFTIKAAYIGLIVILGSMYAAQIGGAEDMAFNLENAVTVFFFLSFLGAPLAFGKAINFDVGTDLLMIDKLRTNASVYLPAKIYERKVVDFVVSLPFVFLLASTDAFTLIESFILLLFSVLAKIIFEAVLLQNFAIIRSKTSNAYKIVSYVYFGLGLLTFAAPYVLIVIGFKFPVRAIVFHPLFISLLIPLTGLAIYYIHIYKHYRKLSWGTVVHYNLALENAKDVQKTQLFGDTSKWHKEEKHDLDEYQTKFSELEGYAFFNKMFFFRHRHYFNKKVLIRAAGVLIFTVAIALIAYFTGDSDQTVEVTDNIANNDESSTNSILPITFFFAYFLSMGRIATAAMFTNCDIAMLQYSFYRTSGVVLENFYYRLKKILQLNAPVFFLLFFLASAVDIFAEAFTSDQSFLSDPSMLSNVNWQLIPLYLWAVIMFWLFFSFHDLFIYYIIQPYTSEMATKSKTFGAVRMLVYMVAYANIWLGSIPIVLYASVVSGFTLLYVFIGLLSLRKFSYKTFKLK